MRIRHASGLIAWPAKQRSAWQCPGSEVLLTIDAESDIAVHGNGRQLVAIAPFPLCYEASSLNVVCRCLIREHLWQRAVAAWKLHLHEH